MISQQLCDIHTITPLDRWTNLRLCRWRGGGGHTASWGLNKDLNLG